jgi:hypothetical protein
MTLDANRKLLIANDRMRQAQADAASERLARTTNRFQRSIVIRLLDAFRPVPAAAPTASVRRHTAGKAG